MSTWLRVAALFEEHALNIWALDAGTYITEDLGALFMDAGLEPGTKTIASSTKSLSFTKPLAASSGAVPDGPPAPAAAAYTSNGNSIHSTPAGRPLMAGRPDGKPAAGLQANS